MKLDFFLREQRDNELRADYYRTKEKWDCEGRSYSNRALLEYVLDTGHPHYHFSFDYARRMLNKVGLDGFLHCKSTLHQAMWHEIADKVAILRRKFPEKTVTEALSLVLADGRASKYYLKYNYAKRIINESISDSSIKHRA